MKIETELKRLETLVESLEDPDLDINNAVGVFQKAMKISERLVSKMNDVQDNIVVLKKEGDRLEKMWVSLAQSS